MSENQEPIVLNEKEEEDFIIAYVKERYDIEVPRKLIGMIIDGQYQFMLELGLIQEL